MIARPERRSLLSDGPISILAWLMVGCLRRSNDVLGNHEVRDADPGQSQVDRVCKEHAGLQQSPVERPFREKTLKMIINVLKENHAIPFFWATVEFDGSVTRMNGQHSSRAILEAGQEIPKRSRFTWTGIKPISNDVIDLFRQFDSRFSSRSTDDVAHAFQMFIPALRDLDPYHMKLSSKAIAWHMGSVKHEKAPHNDEVYSLMQNPELWDFLKWVDRIFNDRSQLKNSELIAAMYATYLKSPMGADRFCVRLAWAERHTVMTDSPAQS